MDYNGPPQVLYYINYALQCLVFLAGIVAGVIAITRKRTLPGILATVAFLFFGVELAVRLVIGYWLINIVNDYGPLYWVGFCTQTPLILLGFIALVVVIFLSAGKKTSLPPPPGLEGDQSGS